MTVSNVIAYVADAEASLPCFLERNLTIAMRDRNEVIKMISTFFRNLGFQLHNKRWSWGARSEHGVLLRAWADDIDDNDRYVRVLGWQTQVLSPRGLNERIDHLRALWSGGLAGYVVIATAADVNAEPRRISGFDADRVRAILSLIGEPDGSIWAELGDYVPIEQLAKHAKKHRLSPSSGTLPQQLEKKQFRDSDAEYIAKVPAARQRLINAARSGETITYAQMREAVGLRSLELKHVMGRIGYACVDAGEPILTCLIVDPKTGCCSSGFKKEFRRDEFKEREDCYAFWSSANGEMSSDRAETMREGAARFACVEVRPEQAAFRRRVFLKYGGKCMVTGCTIVAALDAAHRKGRSWRQGHNSGADGFLLRKDLHALYDAGLVIIDDGGAVAFESDVRTHYQQYLKDS